MEPPSIYHLIITTHVCNGSHVGVKHVPAPRELLFLDPPQLPSFLRGRAQQGCSDASRGAPAAPQPRSPAHGGTKAVISDLACKGPPRGPCFDRRTPCYRYCRSRLPPQLPPSPSMSHGGKSGAAGAAAALPVPTLPRQDKKKQSKNQTN